MDAPALTTRAPRKNSDMTPQRLITLSYVVGVVMLCSLQACSNLPRVILLQDPLSPDEHVSLATSYKSQGLNEIAAKELEAALRKQGNHVPALVALGNLSFERGSLIEAEAYYRQALEVAPNHAGANNNLAMVYLTENRLSEAEWLARKALEENSPIKPYVLETLVQIYTRQQRYREAKVALEEAEVLAPSTNRVLRDSLAQSRRNLSPLE
jgi:tetratricopeptide (TPR) repeat protein